MIEAQLPAYLDGELPTVMHQTVRAHVTACPRCHRVLEGLTAVDRGLSAVAAWQPPSGEKASAVMRAAGVGCPGRSPGISRMVRFAPQLAAAAAVLLMGALFIRRWTGQPSARVSSSAAQGSSPAVSRPVVDLQPYQIGSGSVPVGRAFVIRDGKPQIYGGVTSVTLDAMPSGPAALRVDAFPRESRAARQPPDRPL